MLLRLQACAAKAAGVATCRVSMLEMPATRNCGDTEIPGGGGGGAGGGGGDRGGAGRGMPSGYPGGRGRGGLGVGGGVGAPSTCSVTAEREKWSS